MKRREFITLLGSTGAWPLAARAQQLAKAHRIALVHPSIVVASMSETSDNPLYPALFKELRRLGYVEGQNLVVERYSAAGREDRFPELAREVVRTRPDLIVSATGRLVMSFKAATTTIPIVAASSDPVAFGIVTSVARPGGNITGVSADAGLELWGKLLQIVREAVPTASRVGFLCTRSVWDLAQGRAMADAARRAGVVLVGPPLESPLDLGEYRRVFLAMTQNRAEALIANDQPEHSSYRRVIVGLAEEARLPTIYPFRWFAEIGGLITYGTDMVDVYRRLAGYVDQILKGAKPGELPYYLASKFELVINRKTAKALGLTIPPSLLVRADEVIE